VNELYLAAARNELYASQSRSSTNSWAAEVDSLFTADTTLMGYFNRSFAGGKWNHFMDQPHLGYISWRDPPVNNLQHLSLKNISVPADADMGVSIEGTSESWPGSSQDAILPEFDVYNKQVRYLEIFNRGQAPFDWKINHDRWIRISQTEGKIEKDQRIRITINWDSIPDGRNIGKVTISGTGKIVEVSVVAFKPATPKADELDGFIESNGYVSIEAPHFSRITEEGNNRWLEVQDFGHTLAGMRATTETSLPELIPGKKSPCLEYQMYLFTSGKAEVIAYMAPTLNFIPGKPVRYGISFDDQEPFIVTLVPADFDARNGNRDWELTVSDNYRISKSSLTTSTTGYHTLKIWMIDPGVVLQKLVVNTGGVKESYLGPPESFRAIK
jgi:hypothetical protein